MSLDLKEISIAQWFPELQRHRCGYCKQEDCSISYGMWAESLTVQDYQNLIDRGWRRSGKYCYKPVMNEICCPQYTIRCGALKFKMSKSQKKVIKKLNKFLTDGHLNKDFKPNNINDYEESNIILKHRPNFDIDFTKLEENPIAPSNDQSRTEAAPSCSKKAAVDHNSIVEDSSEKASVIESTELRNNQVNKGLGADPNKPPCKKAKLMRLERKQKKLQEKGLSVEKMETSTEAKTLKQFLNEIPENFKHKLKMKLIRTSNPGRDWVANLDIEHALYKRYQMTVHNDPPEKCTKQSFIRFLVKTPLKIKLEKMHEKHNLFKISAKLYEKYQMVIHNDKKYECDENQFKEFLVENPFQNEDDDDDNGEIQFGSYHQQYWLDDKLIAVGVIDILPRCISSVYFFYDPDYRNLTLGTYGSLREVELTQNLHERIPSIEYYYLGFYIHSCPKMRYKGKLNPSDLLCPETYKWFPIGKCVTMLENSKYARFNEDQAAVDEDACSESDIDVIKILLGYKYTTFRNYVNRVREKSTFVNIGKLIGKNCANTILFVSSNK